MSLQPNDPVYIKGTTMTFAGIVIAQTGNVLACRTSKTSIFRTGLKGNKWIWVGMAAQLSTIAFLVYVPLMQDLLGTTALEPLDWALLALMPCAVILAEEIRKLFARKLAH
jgi:magnesium-transporting ATPase (P-type)